MITSDGIGIWRPTSIQNQGIVCDAVLSVIVTPSAGPTCASRSRPTMTIIGTVGVGRPACEGVTRWCGKLVILDLHRASVCYGVRGHRARTTVCQILDSEDFRCPSCIQRQGIIGNAVLSVDKGPGAGPACTSRSRPTITIIGTVGIGRPASKLHALGGSKFIVLNLDCTAVIDRMRGHCTSTTVGIVIDGIGVQRRVRRDGLGSIHGYYRAFRGTAEIAAPLAPRITCANACIDRYSFTTKVNMSTYGGGGACNTCSLRHCQGIVVYGCRAIRRRGNCNINTSIHIFAVTVLRIDIICIGRNCPQTCRASSYFHCAVCLCCAAI